MRRSAIGAVAAAVLAWWLGFLLPTPPPPADPKVAALSEHFQSRIEAAVGISIASRGFFLRDRDTPFWSLFTDKFGANPNTPCTHSDSESEIGRCYIPF